MREGLMMDDYPLSLTRIVERAERLSPQRKVAFRRPDGSVGAPRSASARRGRAGWAPRCTDSGSRRAIRWRP